MKIEDIIYDIEDYYDSYDTYEGYYEQWDNTATDIKVGDVYTTSSTIYPEKKKVVAIYDDVALCETVDGLGKGFKSMYFSKGALCGWEYNNSSHKRPGYRLTTK